ncbi:unnamed protein product [Chondrus crispus]|uniref:Uncharacterized protein n=1 Tax=Chondrus crispus TaxID=2769 RepID=R7Q8A3_CHOCR|nr:unnamed protein product [Chondrus crispus]CDF33715.1 unnamed protein product [Chondrus crispus]|eukprot:XP_005713534.1 unnamed protein product [Chondrus crispus]
MQQVTLHSGQRVPWAQCHADLSSADERRVSYKTVSMPRGTYSILRAHMKRDSLTPSTLLPSSMTSLVSMTSAASCTASSKSPS